MFLGAGKTGCVCRCALCVRRAGTRGPFHAPTQLKPRYEVKSGKERQEGSRTGHKGAVCEQGKPGEYGECSMSGDRENERRRKLGEVKDDRTISERNERIVGERTQLKTGSVSLRTVDTIHLLRRSQTGDAEDPWSLVRSMRGKHECA